VRVESSLVPSAWLLPAPPPPPLPPSRVFVVSMDRPPKVHMPAVKETRYKEDLYKGQET
jgi:hypothetical protein